MFDFIENKMSFEYLYNVEITPKNPLSTKQYSLQEAYDTLLKEHQNLQFDYQYLQQQLSELKRMVLFKYDPSRSRKVPEELLQNYNGTIQTDGYSGYVNLNTKGSITLLACMAHARRYFEKALDNDASRASYVLEQIQRLYAMERKTRKRESDFEWRKRYRALYAVPVLNKLEHWLKNQVLQVLPKSAIGKAIGYTLKVWDKLKKYITDGRYKIDNNPVENTIRPLALDRKNYLFSGSHRA